MELSVRRIVAGSAALAGLLAPAGIAASPTVSSAAARSASPAATRALSSAGMPATPAGLLPPLPGWRPALRPIFNDPGRKGSRAILRRVLRAIRHTPGGETIRIATYSLDRWEVTSALRRAHRRGVRVQVVVNRRTASGLVYALQRTLGSDPRRRSFVVTCAGRCRAPGPGGNQHIKIASFTRTGGARDVIIGGSGNLTSKAVYRQWNDSWAIADDPHVFDAWVGFFDQMKLQRERGPRVVQASQAAVGHPYFLWWQRRPAAAARRAADDPVVRRIRAVGCRTRPGYGDAHGRTVVRIMEYAVFKRRGDQIATAIVGLRRRGCDVRVIGSVFSHRVIGILRRGGVPVRMGDWRFAHRDPAVEDGLGGWGPRFYAHYKAMLASGSYGGEPTTSVWTGSENWSPLSFANEEVVVRFTDPAYYRAYARQFDRLWRSGATHRAGIEPTYGPPGR